MKQSEILPAACLALLAACASSRPTDFVNVAFTVSVDTTSYRTYDFDLAECEGFDLPAENADFIHEHLLVAIERELGDRGFELRQASAPDFLVSYDLEISPDPDSGKRRSRGRILIRDADSGEGVWRAERKAPLRGLTDREDVREEIDRFAAELIEYVPALLGPESQVGPREDS